MEAADTQGGATLLIDAGEPRPDSDLAGAEFATVTPADVARCVRAARAAGWDPERPGPTFPLLAPSPPSAVAA